MFRVSYTVVQDLLDVFKVILNWSRSLIVHGHLDSFSRTHSCLKRRKAA